MTAKYLPRLIKQTGNQQENSPKPASVNRSVFL